MLGSAIEGSGCGAGSGSLVAAILEVQRGISVVFVCASSCFSSSFILSSNWSYARYCAESSPAWDRVAASPLVSV